MEERIYNFSAGPATLPLPVLQRAQEEFLAYPGAGASVMEISHRSQAFAGIHANTKENLKKLLGLPDGYQILFTPGGATMQFSMLAMNFLAGTSADYIHTGSWGGKAINEARKHGTVREAWSGKDEGFVRTPKDEELDLDPNAAYVHFTSNETIHGVEFFEEPSVGGKPLFCDASSDFLSRPLDMGKYALLYAGAQKNVGPSGMAVVILREDLLENTPEQLPSLLDYKVLVEKDSLYNTPPTFTIYIVGLVAQWLLDEIGGLEKMAAQNARKAAMLYEVVDGSGGFYNGHAQAESRSRMNVTFRLPTPELEAEFVSEAREQGLDGLKGHRSVGGCRASIYNAMPVAGCEALRDFMTEFQRTRG